MCSPIDTNQQAFHFAITVKYNKNILKFTGYFPQYIFKGYIES